MFPKIHDGGAPTTSPLGARPVDITPRISVDPDQPADTRAPSRQAMQRGRSAGTVQHRHIPPARESFKGPTGERGGRGRGWAGKRQTSAVATVLQPLAVVAPAVGPHHITPPRHHVVHPLALVSAPVPLENSRGSESLFFATANAVACSSILCGPTACLTQVLQWKPFLTTVCPGCAGVAGPGAAMARRVLDKQLETPCTCFPFNFWKLAPR